MATEKSPEYGINDSTYEVIIHAPIARRRTYLDTDKGELRRFYVQLEYNRRPSFDQRDDWVDIARFDHQPGNEYGHNIRKEGLHMDLCHPSESDRRVTDFPRVPLKQAPYFCEDYFDRNYNEICIQYANWEENLTSSIFTLLDLS
jgi:hypothetical protein